MSFFSLKIVPRRTCADGVIIAVFIGTRSGVYFGTRMTQMTRIYADSACFDAHGSA